MMVKSLVVLVPGSSKGRGEGTHVALDEYLVIQ